MGHLRNEQLICSAVVNDDLDDSRGVASFSASTRIVRPHPTFSPSFLDRRKTPETVDETFRPTIDQIIVAITRTTISAHGTRDGIAHATRHGRKQFLRRTCRAFEQERREAARSGLADHRNYSRQPATPEMAASTRSTRYSFAEREPHCRESGSLVGPTTPRIPSDSDGEHVGPSRRSDHYARDVSKKRQRDRAVVA